MKLTFLMFNSFFQHSGSDREWVLSSYCFTWNSVYVYALLVLNSMLAGQVLSSFLQYLSDVVFTFVFLQDVSDAVFLHSINNDRHIIIISYTASECWLFIQHSFFLLKFLYCYSLWVLRHGNPHDVNLRSFSLLYFP